jgi:hypothetical protein
MIALTLGILAAYVKIIRCEAQAMSPILFLQSFGEFAIRDVVLRTDNRACSLFAFDFDFDMQDAETDFSQSKAVSSIAPDNRPGILRGCVSLILRIDS